jgi:hypothetical protein
MLEPNLAAAEQERDEAKSIRNRAQLELTKAESRVNAVFEADRALTVRENELSQGLHTIQQAKAEILQQQRGVDADRAALHARQQTLEAERFQLHSAAVEMREQVLEMQQAMKLLMQTKRQDVVSLRLGHQHQGGQQQENRLTNREGRSSSPALPGAKQQQLVEHSPTTLDPTLQRALLSLNTVAQALEGPAGALQASIQHSQSKQQQLPLQLLPPPPTSSQVAVQHQPLPRASVSASREVVPTSGLGSDHMYEVLRKNRDFDEFYSTVDIRSSQQSGSYSRGFGTMGNDIASVLNLQHSLDNADALAASLREAAKRFA